MFLKDVLCNLKPILKDLDRPFVDPGILQISDSDFDLDIGVIPILLSIFTLHEVLKCFKYLKMTKIPILNLNFGLNQPHHILSNKIELFHHGNQ